LSDNRVITMRATKGGVDHVSNDGRQRLRVVRHEPGLPNKPVSVLSF
jgi:hypothetical protein